MTAADGAPLEAVRTFIGIGSNLDDPLAQVRRALTELAELPGCSGLSASPLYRSRPMGPQDQPDYINAVARLVTTLAPLRLLDVLQGIEQAHGRVRGPERWGPRTLDLDLLLYGNSFIEHPRLRVPHPGLTQRAFVLIPLADIQPDLLLGDGRSVAALRDACAEVSLERVG